jgi:hypothetical protein
MDHILWLRGRAGKLLEGESYACGNSSRDDASCDATDIRL